MRLPNWQALKRRIMGDEYELQESEGLVMVWFSGPPYIDRQGAIDLACRHVMRPGRTLRVRNVRTGKVVFSRVQ